MARKLIDQLFPSSKEGPAPQRVSVSLKSWTSLVSRLNQLEKQLKNNREQTEALYSLIKNWITEEHTFTQHQQKILSQAEKIFKSKKKTYTFKNPPPTAQKEFDPPAEPYSAEILHKP